MPNLPIFALDARLVGGVSTGDSTYWTGLLGGLKSIAPQARFLLYSNAPAPAGIPHDERFIWCPLESRNSRWWSLVRFPLAARRAGAAAIHTQYSLSPLAGPRGITTIHDVSFFVGPQWFKARDRLLLRTSVPASARRAWRIFAVSETSRREIERYIPGTADKIVVTPNACPSWVHRKPRDVAAANVQRDFGVNGPFVLTVGTRWPRKNMDLAVQACELLPRDLPHQLVVTGKSGWGPSELGSRGLAVGYVSNEQLCDLYSAADLYLAPSRHEGFGIPLLEAFRCGCPVLSSSGGALPEVAADAAVIEPSWEASVWSSRILELLHDSGKLSDLRRKGEVRESEFTWEATARKTLETYMGAIA